MAKQWFVIVYVDKCGGAESGPMMSTSEIYIKSKSLEKAKKRAARIWEDGEKDRSYGYFVSEVTDDYKEHLESWLKFTWVDEEVAFN